MSQMFCVMQGILGFRSPALEVTCMYAHCMHTQKTIHTCFFSKKRHRCCGVKCQHKAKNDPKMVFEKNFSKCTQGLR